MTYEEKRQMGYQEAERRELAQLEDFTKLMPELAAILGLGWRVAWTFESGEPLHKGSARLLDTNGRDLHLSVDDFRPNWRLAVSGNYRHADHSLSVGWWNLERPSITADMKRGAEVLAKDIARRFLPAYDTARAAWDKRVTEATAARDSKRGRIAHFATLLGMDLTKCGPDQEQLYEYIKTPGVTTTVDVTVKIHSCDINLELRDLSDVLAEKIIRLVKSERAAAPLVVPIAVAA